MNRSLTLPAICCALAFAALYTSIAQSKATRTPREAGIEREAPVALARVEPRDTPSLQQPAAAALLQQQLIDPWRQSLESAPHRMFSRARLQPITIVPAWASLDGQPQRNTLLGSVTISGGRTAHQRVPFAIDRATEAIYVFTNDTWQQHDQWLASLKSPLERPPRRDRPAGD